MSIEIKQTVYVEWIDATGKHETLNEYNLLEMRPLVCKSAGLLVEANDDYVLLIQDAFDENEEKTYRDSLLIPRAYVQHMEIFDLKGRCESSD